MVGEVEDTLLSVVVVTHFGGFTGRGFSPGFSGTRGFYTGRFSGRGTEANKDRSGSVFKHRRIFVALPALQLIVGACFSWMSCSEAGISMGLFRNL